MRPNITRAIKNLIRYTLLSLPLFLFTFCQSLGEEVIFIKGEALTKDSNIVSLMLEATKSTNSNTLTKSANVDQCTEFKYPVEFEFYFRDNIEPKIRTVNNDDELAVFLNSLTDDSGFYIKFPLSLIDIEGEETIVYSLSEFEGILDIVVKACIDNDDSDDDDSDDDGSDEEDNEYDFCSSNNKKVYICHKGNTICVSINAVWGHLAHHNEDYLGQCN